MMMHHLPAGAVRSGLHVPLPAALGLLAEQLQQDGFAELWRHSFSPVVLPSRTATMLSCQLR